MNQLLLEDNEDEEPSCVYIESVGDDGTRRFDILYRGAPMAVRYEWKDKLIQVADGKDVVLPKPTQVRPTAQLKQLARENGLL